MIKDKFRFLPTLLAGVLLFSGPAARSQEASPPAAEAEPTPNEPELQFRGLLWNSYSSNFNVPSTGKNAFRGYDFDDRKLKMDMLELDLQYGLDLPDQTGFRLDVTGGGSMPRVDAATNLFRNQVTGISNADFDIRQAFFSYSSDFGMRVDVGKFSTIFGYEILSGVDGINPNATVSWTYTYSPFTYTGLRVTYPLSDEVTFTGVAVTGADVFTDNNSRPSFGAQLSVKPMDGVVLNFNVLHGPERYLNNVDNRLLLDFNGAWQVHEAVKLGVHTIAGKERFSDVASPYTGYWNSLVLFMENTLTDEFSLNLRQEWFNDPQGVRTGLAQYLRGFTVSPVWNVTEDLVLRLDYRIDGSSVPAFDRRGQRVDYQPTLYFNQILRF